MQRLSLVPARGAVGAAAPRGTTIIAKRVVVGAARRLVGVVLVDAFLANLRRKYYAYPIAPAPNSYIHVT